MGSTPGTFIALHSPAVMEDFIREIGRRIEDAHNPPEPEGPLSDEEQRKMMEIIHKYMEVLPPDETMREETRR